MAAKRILHLCNNVEALALRLEKLNERASGEEAQAVLLRMRLAALTTELIATDLIERARQPFAMWRLRTAKSSAR